MTERLCAGCPRTISAKNKTGRCRSCCARAITACPKARAKARASLIERMRDPETRAQHVARSTAGIRRKMAEDPAFAANRREQGRRCGLSLASHKAHPAGSPSRIRAGQSVSATRLAWCPPTYRDAYRGLIKRHGIKGAEARRMIEAQVAADRARMSPFERQMDAVMRGAAITIEPVMPVRAYDFTLGGGSPL